MCVSKEKECDGKTDCFDGRDEHFKCPGVKDRQHCPDPYLSEWGEPYGEPGCDMFCGSEKAWGDKRPVYFQDRLCIAHEFNVTLDTCVQIQDQKRAKEFCFPGAEYTRRKPCPVNHCLITAVRTRTGRGPGDQGSKSGDYLFKVGYDEDHFCTLGWLDNENKNERDKGELDEYTLDVACDHIALKLDGSQPLFPYIEVSHPGHTDGWKYQTVDLRVNDKVQSTYGKGVVWMGKKGKKDRVKSEIQSTKKLVYPW
ncbi:uncharacterized protein LOC142347842 [Convolutriloba macropyga]|uniref:uncharacterized protein LOC142347842 n=1 Tax=Convolutriloba macropyga TaxID=536237 RepID=UPI003F51B27A